MFNCMTDSLPWLTPLPSVEKEQKEVPAPASPAVPVPTRSLARPAGKERKRNPLTEAAEQTEAFQLEIPPELALLREIAEQEGAVLGDRDFVMLTSSTLLSPMEKDERILRTTFVQEYLFDFDPIAAACRCGYKDERVGAGVVRFSANQRLGVAWTETGTVAPTTTDVSIVVLVAFDDVNLVP